MGGFDSEGSPVRGDNEDEEPFQHLSPAPSSADQPYCPRYGSNPLGELNHLEELNTIMIASTVINTSSNPASAGPSSPPLEQTKSAEIVPPTRPSSTPYPLPDYRNGDCCDPMILDDDDDDDYSPLKQKEERITDLATTPNTESSRNEEQMSINDLPIEIHEGVLDELFGLRSLPKWNKAAIVKNPSMSWNTALRHSRRKELSALALVSRIWKGLVQERLFRHVKLKATVEELTAAMSFFFQNIHLRAYVKHVEFWFPVFQVPAHLLTPLALPAERANSPRPVTNPTFTIPQDNCTLEDVLYFIADALPTAFVLTLEGGDRKKAPQVLQSAWMNGNEYRRKLPALPAIRTLVTRGQWNLLRKPTDFEALLLAFPNLNEWHGSYNKSKSKSYLSVSSILPALPESLTSLHMCMETDYRRELTCPPFFLKVSEQVHFCVGLAAAASRLDSFSYTGRVCKTFFNDIAVLSDPRTTRLQSIDITVKNCCREMPQIHNSGSGIQDIHFIHAFEKLVISAIRSLSKLRSLEYLRIRFVDLDSPVPPLNPYFVLRGNLCLGVWSDAIITELAASRPSASFEELNDSFGDVGFNKDGRLVLSPGREYGRAKFRSLKLANYALLVGSISAMG